MKKTIIGLLVTTMLCSALFTGCGEKKTVDGGNEERYTVTVGYPKAEDTWCEDEYFKYITDKVGIDIEFTALSADTAAEKARIWISSGGMPDMVFTDFLMDEYLQYGEQGVVKTMPTDIEEKYPNLGFSMAMTRILSELKEAGNGDIYGLVRPLDHYRYYIDDFRAAYAEGKDMAEMMLEQPYLYIDTCGFAYRKDWAKQLGIETDYIMEYDDFIDMVLKFKEADLGGVGPKNTIGVAVSYTEAPNIFITAFNSSYKYFHKDETGKYICGLLEDSTTEGVVAFIDAYRKGVLANDFYTQKSKDLNSLFCSQRSGIIFPKSDPTSLRTLRSDFAKANPGVNPDEAIGVCWIKSPDGKVHGRESGNHNRVWYFNPELSDEKLDKILQLGDYVTSPEGGKQIRYGVPGVDYDEDYNIISDLANKAIADKYPSATFFATFLNPQFTMPNMTDPLAYEESKKLDDAKKAEDLSLLTWDAKRDFYVAEDYVKFNAKYEVNSMFAELVVSDGDPRELWNKKRAEIAEAAKSVEDNMNKALLGK